MSYRYPKAKLLITDMALDACHNLHKLSEGLYYWFIDIEVRKTSGRLTRRKIVYFQASKAEYPTFEAVMDLIKAKFSREVA